MSTHPPNVKNPVRYTGSQYDLTNVVLDFETYWADDYTLKKMSPAEYILDERFEALGCAVAWDDRPAFWVDGPDLPAWFEKVPWPALRVITHNALFDACILSWRYGVNPAQWCCTLSLARASLRPKLKSLSLASIAHHFNMPDKTGAVHLFKGYRFGDLRSHSIYESMVDYAKHDAELCRMIFHQLAPMIGAPIGSGSGAQLPIIDMVIRMATDPQFKFDQTMLLEHLQQVVQEKQNLLDRLGLDDRSMLMSDESLAQMLREVGVEPPTKVSPTTGKLRYAFAKTDKDFTDMADDPNPQVQAIVAARLGHKTTIEETRTERFLNISRLSWPIGEQGWAPVPLAYSGAHTHRFSGDWKLNMQNLGRQSKLRKALIAPPGKMVVAVDASQIEARFLATLAGQVDLIQQFTDNEDVYAKFASLVFGYTITKQTHKRERDIGKVGVLQLGYGSSWPKLQHMLRMQGLIVDDAECARIVDVYRNTMGRIVDYWSKWQNRLRHLSGTRTLIGANMAVGLNQVILPTGNVLHYYNLREQPDDDGRMQFVYDFAGKTKKIYGSKMVENVVQALAFGAVMEAALRIQHRTNGLLKLALQGHDELVYVVDEKLAEHTRKFIRWEMARPPNWLPEVPLAAEAGFAKSYGDIVKF